LAGRYDVGLDNRIMPEVAARVPPFASASEKIRPAGRVLQEALRAGFVSRQRNSQGHGLFGGGSAMLREETGFCKSW
jgi:hypothetical protein